LTSIIYEVYNLLQLNKSVNHWCGDNAERCALQRVRHLMRVLQ